ncbi:MAG: DUF4465 domain-containing protein [Bacteroidia bacterium]
MKKTVLGTLLLFGAFLHGKAQTLINFESSLLPESNSYWNGSDGTAAGITEQSCFFPTVWDTSFGGYWLTGFALSNMTDSVTSGFGNMYSAKSGSGYAQSAQYAVAYGNHYFTLSAGIIDSMRITNNTYAYNSMRDGDAFSKKFGGLSGNDPDYFRIIFKGFLQGSEKPDSVIFYLADFRSDYNFEDYIVRDWTGASLITLGNVDSVTYRFESSDVGNFGINTPSYFCLDALQISNGSAGIHATTIQSAPIAYPNPASHAIFFKEEILDCAVFNSLGKLVFRQDKVSGGIDIRNWENGVYVLLSRNSFGTRQQTRIVVSH